MFFRIFQRCSNPAAGETLNEREYSYSKDTRDSTSERQEVVEPGFGERKRPDRGIGVIWTGDQQLALLEGDVLDAFDYSHACGRRRRHVLLHVPGTQPSEAHDAPRNPLSIIPPVCELKESAKTKHL